MDEMQRDQCGAGVYGASPRLTLQVYRLLTSGTIEEIKYIRQLYKTHLADQTLHVCLLASLNDICNYVVITGTC